MRWASEDHTLARVTSANTELAPRDGPDFACSVDLALLSGWAIDARYPDDFEEGNRAQAAEAVACAHEVLVIVTRHLTISSEEHHHPARLLPACARTKSRPRGQVQAESPERHSSARM